MPNATDELMKAPRVRLHLNVHEPIELVEMTLAFQGLSNEYHSFLKENKIDVNNKNNIDEIKLYITKIESNCILAELAPALPMLGVLAPFVTDINTVVDFVKNTRDFIYYLINASSDKDLTKDDIPYSKKKINSAKDVVKLIAKNKNSNLGLHAIKFEQEIGADKIVLEATFSSDECKKAEEGAYKIINLLDETEKADKEKVLMYFYQTNSDDPKSNGRTGDKAIINSITEKPLSVYFLSEIDQQRVRYLLDDKSHNPLLAGFVVDVNIEKDRRGNPKIYRVLRVHDVSYDED